MSTQTKKASSKPRAASKPKPSSPQTKSPEDTEKEKLDKLQKSQTVKHTFLTTGGGTVHLCEDGEFRTDEEMQELGKEEDN